MSNIYDIKILKKIIRKELLNYIDILSVSNFSGLHNIDSKIMQCGEYYIKRFPSIQISMETKPKCITISNTFGNIKYVVYGKNLEIEFSLLDNVHFQIPVEIMNYENKHLSPLLFLRDFSVGKAT